MTKPAHIIPSDVREAARLATDATLGLTDLVEAVHAAVAAGPRLLASRPPARTRGLTGLVYRNVRGVARAAGAGADAVLRPLVPRLRSSVSSQERDAVVAALNGVLGDRLAALGSPLATEMELRLAGNPLDAGADALPRALEASRGRLLLLVHGLCLNERSWDRAGAGPWGPGGVARQLGTTELRLRYDTGLHVSTNGRRLAALLEALALRWPREVEEISIVGFSVGGLLARSAVHYGTASGHGWPRRLRGLVFLGTPHHGAPLERIGHAAELALAATPWSAPFARLGRIRSAGITDLRHGSLVDEDWEGRDRFARGRDERLHVPLPAGVRCFAAAASAGRRRGVSGEVLLGDGLVPVPSALGYHADPERSLRFPRARTRVFEGTKHLDLLSRPDVAQQVAAWLAR